MSLLSRIYLFISCCLFIFSVKAQAQDPYENVVQINGVTMTADSLRAVPNVTVLIRNKYRGVESGFNGVFSIVAYKGDTLQFSAVGYRSKEYIIPRNVQGHYFSMIQLMTQDTFYLPETIIRAVPTKQQFEYAFRHWHIPDDKLEIARKNTNAITLRALAFTLPRDGRENQAILQQTYAQQAVYYGQARPMNIFSPTSWAEFYESWKRGDFRRRK